MRLNIHPLESPPNLLTLVLKKNMSERLRSNYKNNTSGIRFIILFDRFFLKVKTSFRCTVEAGSKFKTSKICWITCEQPFFATLRSPVVRVIFAVIPHLLHSSPFVHPLLLLLGNRPRTWFLCKNTRVVFLTNSLDGVLRDF